MSENIRYSKGYRDAAVESIEQNKLHEAQVQATLAVAEAVDRLTHVINLSRREKSAD